MTVQKDRLKWLTKEPGRDCTRHSLLQDLHRREVQVKSEIPTSAMAGLLIQQGPATSHKGNFLLYCERHYIKLKTMTMLWVSSVLPQRSTLEHLSWLQLLPWANLRSASIWAKGFRRYLEIMHTFRWCYVNKMGFAFTRDKNPLALPILYKGFLTSSHALPSK